MQNSRWHHVFIWENFWVKPGPVRVCSGSGWIWFPRKVIPLSNYQPLDRQTSRGKRPPIWATDHSEIFLTCLLMLEMPASGTEVFLAELKRIFGILPSGKILYWGLAHTEVWMIQEQSLFLVELNRFPARKTGLVHWGRVRYQISIILPYSMGYGEVMKDSVSITYCHLTNYPKI